MTSIALVCVFVGITVFAFIYAITGITNKYWQSFLPLLMSLLTCFYELYFVFTPFNLRLDYKLHLESREQVIELENNEEIAQFQINEKRYMPPQRMASFDGTVTVQVDDSGKHFVFNSFKGFGKSATIVYSSNEGESDYSFISNNVLSVIELDDHWVAVVFK
ncbi:hypothetical protein [Phosphitispora sp. TUW77]|uniref:hypothetical protein n=1 Tax=Phosphitispora sp. TUW77 TaxID=3152361 RepID=UPI003AB86842